MNTREKAIFKNSIATYGKEAQCRQAMEECAELIQAINQQCKELGWLDE